MFHKVSTLQEGAEVELDAVQLVHGSPLRSWVDPANWDFQSSQADAVEGVYSTDAKDDCIQ